MNTKIAISRNLFIRSVAVTSLSVASFVLMGACQSYDEAWEAMDTEEPSTLETSDAEAVGTDSDGAAEADITDVGTAEEALLTAPLPAGSCEVRCCSNSLHAVATANKDGCITFARSICGGVGKSKRIKYGGVYIFSRVC